MQEVMMPILSENTRVLIGHLQVTNRMTRSWLVKKQLRFLFLQLIVMEELSPVGLRLISKPIEEIHDIIASINEENIETETADCSKKNDEFTIVSQQFNELLDKISFYIAPSKAFRRRCVSELRTPCRDCRRAPESTSRWGKMTQKCWKESL